MSWTGSSLKLRKEWQKVKRKKEKRLEVTKFVNEEMQDHDKCLQYIKVVLESNYCDNKAQKALNDFLNQSEFSQRQKKIIAKQYDRVIAKESKID